MIILGLLVGSFLYLLRTRFRDRFLRAYGLFFLILLVYASNKAAYGVSPDMAESAFSPLSLVRWGLLAVLFLVAVRMKTPPGFRPDILLAGLSGLLLGHMLLSSTYAENFNYSFYRALSFTLLAIACLVGATFYLHRAEHCVQYYRFHYYAAWIAIVPMLLLHLAGLGRFGVTIIMGQYAGMFGNQNMYGTFSALIMPYVIFHWRIVARTKREKWIDVALIALIFVGLYFSRSRNGFISCLLGMATYYFVINLQSRLKIVAATVCLALAFIAVPTLQEDLTEFIRKGSTPSEFGGVSSQFIEEKRYEMWRGVLPLFWKEKLTGYGFASSHLLVFPFTKDEEAGRALHNSYLEIFGDLGLPGLTLLLLILARVGSKAIWLVRSRGEFFERNINAVLIAVFVAGSFNAFFESWMFSVGNLISLMYWGPAAGVVARWAWRPMAAAHPRHGPLAARPELSYVR
jgi:hypothetical protein